MAQIKSIDENYHIFSPSIKEMVVTGMSAGAVSAYHWVDYLKSKIHNETILHFIADSPVFLNRQNFYTKQY